MQRILIDAEKRAAELLQKNREDLDKLAAALLKDEEIDRAGVDAILRKAPPPEKTPEQLTAEASPVPHPPDPKLAFGGA